MDLEDISGVLWFLNFQIFGQIDIEFGQEFIRDDFSLLFIEVSYKYLLSGSIESQLFLDDLIRTFTKDFSNLIMIIKFNSNSEGNSIF